MRPALVRAVGDLEHARFLVAVRRRRHQRHVPVVVADVEVARGVDDRGGTAALDALIVLPLDLAGLPLGAPEPALVVGIAVGMVEWKNDERIKGSGSAAIVYAEGNLYIRYDNGYMA